MEALKAFKGRLAFLFLMFVILSTNAMAGISTLDTYWTAQDTADLVSFLAAVATILVSIGMAALSLFLITKLFAYVRTTIK